MAITTKRLDPNTQNVDTGVVITHSDYIPAYDKAFGSLATVIKAEVAGTIVYQNGAGGEPGVWSFEAGEGWLIACDRILTSATINGTLRTTSVAAGSIIWATTAADMKPEQP